MDAEKRIFDWVVSREGVCGGDACIRGTRIQVWMLYRMQTEGASDDDLMELYDLDAEALSAAWGYVEKNKEAMVKKINENQCVPE